ncbi:single-stranded DNA-binding protein [Peptostreptococcus porci]|uniref:single-stranded DNA-binding protein n=1 Tax=Peptostreptococcus porci TaxID=2652282 RepID=UPI002A831DBB|nr:single-stranded DNA-binding protein [Peptostreptococcus porci]MDY4128682.1 single-stranded DNA-binding protein [Peptostreptococcus porci]
MNSVVLIGRLTKDPEIRYIPTTGTPVAAFTLAIDRDYKNKDGSTTTDFIPVELMGKPAEFCSNYITKGRLVAIQGSVRIEKYEKDGEKRTFTKVVGKNIQALDSKKDEHEQSDSESPAKFDAVENDDVPF